MLLRREARLFDYEHRNKNIRCFSDFLFCIFGKITLLSLSLYDFRNCLNFIIIRFQAILRKIFHFLVVGLAG